MCWCRCCWPAKLSEHAMHYKSTITRNNNSHSKSRRGGPWVSSLDCEATRRKDIRYYYWCTPCTKTNATAITIWGAHAKGHARVARWSTIVNERCLYRHWCAPFGYYNPDHTRKVEYLTEPATAAATKAIRDSEQQREPPPRSLLVYRHSSA
jgi:hypothetical protein